MLEYSPTLSVATAAFELSAAAWVMRAPGRRELMRPIALILALLAGYQLIEVMVCHRPHEVFWARLAFADVVWLPPLGWLWLHRVARPRAAAWSWLVAGAMVGAAFFSVWVFVDDRFVTASVCQAVIAKYTHPTLALEAYGAFYHLGLWGMMAGGVVALTRLESRRDRAHVGDYLLGTMAFVVLALTTEVVVPATRGATPSVMCHYALLLAVFLVRLARREARAAAAAPAPLAAGA